MSDIAALADAARRRASEYTQCSHEQALTYACEDIVEAEFGSREISASEAEQWVTLVCDREDLDTPSLFIARASKSTAASASRETHSICVRGRRTCTATLLHEIAHLSCGADSHAVIFRDEFVRLARAHISVSYAALLHTLFTAVGLEMSPWQASASRR